MVSPAASCSCLQAELFPSTRSHDLDELSLIKRFVDRCQADEKLRERTAADPAAVATEHGLPMAADSAGTSALYRSYLEQRRSHRLVMREQCAPTSAPFRAWRERQIRRCLGQLPSRYNEAILHLPVAFELCQGCSVGCWFCGFSAPHLQSVFQATPENRQLWQDTLTVFRDLAGGAAGRGICFWATDPLDNPDYETFCLDFHAVLGRFPPTTTALVHKDPDRVRRLLSLSWQKGGEFNRFSVLSLSILKKIFELFSPQDLLYVDIIPQNPDALADKALAGRALGSSQEAITGEPSTIACVSGFLVNMVARTVKLVSPCPADLRWTEGYRVHASATFQDATQLRDCVEGMVAGQMPSRVYHDACARLRPDLEEANRPSTLFRRPEAVHALFDLLTVGTLTAGEVALAMESHGVDLPQTFDALQTLFEEGWLDDEPG